MKCDRRWWNDGRLERELEARALGYEGVVYLGGIALHASRRDAPTLLDAARLARWGMERLPYRIRVVFPPVPPRLLVYAEES